MSDLSAEELADIVEQLEDSYEPEENWEPVGKSKIRDQGRWWTRFEQVYKRIDQEQWILVAWQRGSTEQQEVDPKYEVFEVWPHVVQKTVYKQHKPT